MFVDFKKEHISQFIALLTSFISKLIDMILSNITHLIP